MLVKHPKSNFRKWLKRGAVVAFVVEGVCFIACYGIWDKINRDRDFRLYLRDSYPFALELFYKTGEVLGKSQARSVDQAYWEAEARKGSA